MPKSHAAEKLAIERKPTGDLVAFELYSRAISLTPTLRGGADSGRQAIDLLNQAVARDPSFFEAYCELAVHHDQLYFFNLDHTPARLAAAEAAIQEAFRIRPNAGEAHLARAYHLYNGYLDYEGALAELEVARQTLPNDPRIFRLTGFIQRRQGHWEESIKISSGHLSSTRATSTRSTTSEIVTQRSGVMLSKNRSSIAYWLSSQMISRQKHGAQAWN